MAMNLTGIITAANNLFLTVPGIKRAYTEAPDQLPSGNGDLPCVVPIVDKLVMDAAGPSYQHKVYTIKYLLVIAPFSKGLVAVEKQARPFMDLVADTFFDHVKLNSPSDVTHAYLKEMEYKAILYNMGKEAPVYLGYECFLEATIKVARVQNP